MGEYKIEDAMFDILTSREASRAYKSPLIIGQKVPLGTIPNQTLFVYAGMNISLKLDIPPSLPHEGCFNAALGYLSPCIRYFILRYFQRYHW